MNSARLVPELRGEGRRRMQAWCTDMLLVDHWLHMVSIIEWCIR